MKSKKPKLMMGGHTDEMFTPDYALEPLVPFLDKSKVIWECAYGDGALAKHLKKRGFKVVGCGKDFMKTIEEYDIIITNPLIQIKKVFWKELMN